jgi:hypothetical protein
LGESHAISIGTFTMKRRPEFGGVDALNDIYQLMLNPRNGSYALLNICVIYLGIEEENA